MRFLDYRTPTDITQVGYYIPANGSTWAAYWSPTDPNGEIVYTADAYRGVDVLRIDERRPDRQEGQGAGGKSWFGSPASDSATFEPHPTFGFVCPVLKSGLHAP